MEYAKRTGKSAKAQYRRDYRSFRGVDFSSVPEQVSDERSPDAENVCVDRYGCLVKRPGYRIVGKYPEKINGIHRLAKNGRSMIVVHSGDSLWLHGAVPRLISTQVGNKSSFSIVCEDRLWILTGSKYLVFDGNKVARVKDIAYVPTIKIGCEPSNGAGTVYEAVNLLSDMRKVRYIGDGITTTYLVDSDGYDSVDSATVNGEKVHFAEDMGKRTISFSFPPGTPSVSGQDNVEIVYKKHIDGNSEVIEKCSVMGLYGLGGADSDRVFFTGNPDKRHMDWYCSVSSPKFNVDPTYVPDNSFAKVGSDSCAIVGYRRIGAYQLIIKEQNDQDASVYLRRSGVDADGNPYFALIQGASGLGAISSATLANLGDEPLFLSKYRGICGVVLSQVTDVTSVQNRSWFVDSRLTNEPDLKNAVSVEWLGRYCLFVNNHVYVLDSRQSKTYREHSGSSYVYECFYWSGVPAICVCESDGDLFFGTENGAVCKFNTDLSDDSGIYRDRPTEKTEIPVSAYWTTAVSDDGYIGRWKKTVSRQCALTTRSVGGVAEISCDMNTDGEPWENLIHFEPLGAALFESADFSSWSFETEKMPVSLGVGKKPGRYITVSLRISNQNIGENLLCEGLTRGFFVDKKMKG